MKNKKKTVAKEVSQEAVSIRRYFIREFTKNVVNAYLNMYPDKFQEIRIKAVAARIKSRHQINNHQPLQVSNEQIPIKKPTMMQMRRMPIMRRPIRYPSRPQPRISELPVQIPQQKQKIVTPIVSLEKIRGFLSDPAVQSVECPGPEKPLLINKSGLIQTAGLILTKEEIDSIMNEISERTKIPVIEGLFKAVYGNLVISAVASQYVGTRFIIQKRLPV